MGILNRLKQAFGLSAEESGHHAIRSAVGASHASRALSRSGAFDSQSIDRSKYHIDPQASAATRGSVARPAPQAPAEQGSQPITTPTNGDLGVRTSPLTPIFTSSQDETLVLEINATDTSIEIPTQRHDASDDDKPMAADKAIDKSQGAIDESQGAIDESQGVEQVDAGPIDPYDEFGLDQFGLDIGDDLAGEDEWDDEEGVAEFSEEGVCPRCWKEDGEESHAEHDRVSGLMICPRCKCSFRTSFRTEAMKRDETPHEE